MRQLDYARSALGGESEYAQMASADIFAFTTKGKVPAPVYNCVC
jgi:hypothetical protein